MAKSIYQASDVAKYFIYLASQALVGDNNEREGITNLKLQKILYFAQAYYLAKLNKPLFLDKIEAWTYGPVVPNIYKAYKEFESNPIIQDEDTTALSLEDKEHLKIIWNSFGGYSASRLVDISHAHTPWKEAFKRADKLITQDSLKEYYSDLLN